MNIMNGMIRTLKDATEHNLKIHLAPDHPHLPWPVEHAAEMRNHYKVGVGGRTPVERDCGRRVANKLFEFAEKGLYML